MQARYQSIKHAIVSSIQSGDLSPGDRVASENQLCELHNVSRMTARRALTELVDEGVLFRSQGLGTFVADPRPMGSMLTIRSIAEEVTSRGHEYSYKLLKREAINVNEHQAALLGMNPGDNAFHVRFVHYENAVAVQLEDRLVNASMAPALLEQDYDQVSVNQYLSDVAPLTEADHSVEAILPPDDVAQSLDLSPLQPCLQVSRRTYSQAGIVSYATLIHPGNRYRLGGHLDFPTRTNSK